MLEESRAEMPLAPGSREVSQEEAGPRRGAIPGEGRTPSSNQPTCPGCPAHSTPRGRALVGLPEPLTGGDGAKHLEPWNAVAGTRLWGR